MNLSIYKISCYSKCGSYFASYLQSVTVIASDKEDAVQQVKDEGSSFIYPESEWDVEELAKYPLTPGIIDYEEDSDY